MTPSAALSVVAAAEEHPHRELVRFRGSSWTYGDAARDALVAFSQWSTARDDDVTRPVALVASPDREGLTALYALLHAQIPVLLLHPRSTGATRNALIARVGATLVLDEDGTHQRSPAGNEPSSELGDQIYIATSGTTSWPKVVALTQANLLASAHASQTNLPLDEDSCWGLTLPFSHVGGLSVLTRCLIARAGVAVINQPLIDAKSWEFIEESRVTHLSLVPTQLSRALSFGVVAPPTLRHVLVGGALCASSLRSQARDAGWPILCTYGLTEACSQVATQSPYTEAGSAVDSGPALSGFEVVINDAGCICVRGDAVMRGYVGEPALPRDGWLETRDLGHIDASGRLTVLGRIDDVIISGGENVSPAQVEQSLMSLPAIDEACVVGCPDEDWGSRVVAVVEGRQIDDEQLRTSLQGLLEVHAVPKTFIWVKELPRLANQKLDRAAVYEIVAKFASHSAIDPHTPSAEMDEL